MAIEIPNKSFFKINEVCSLTNVKPYVLRFWESEFEEISPMTSSSGQKLYEHKDIEAILLIKKLLFDDKLTVESAKAEIKMCYRQSSSEEQSNEESIENDSSVSSNTSRMGLSEDDIQKLVMAKKQLNQLLDISSDIKNRFQWH